MSVYILSEAQLAGSLIARTQVRNPSSPSQQRLTNASSDQAVHTMSLKRVRRRKTSGQLRTPSPPVRGSMLCPPSEGYALAAGPEADADDVGRSGAGAMFGRRRMIDSVGGVVVA
jgi:hypothetical protein